MLQQRLPDAVRGEFLEARRVHGKMHTFLVFSRGSIPLATLTAIETVTSLAAHHPIESVS